MKKTVLVLFGGVSSEHEISRLSVTSVLNHIDRENNIPLAVGITKDGTWLQYTGDVSLIKDGSWEKEEDHLFPCILSPDRSHHGILVYIDGTWVVERVDVVFPVLHGKNGEDGTIQGLLELADIPYVGCGVVGSANCMDKDIAKTLFSAAGVPNAKWITVRSTDVIDVATLERDIAQSLGYPAFIKPANAGSSVGVSRIDGADQLVEALKLAFAQDKKLIIEEAIYGAEVECGIIGNDFPVPSTVLGEIVPLRGVYDYEGKYMDGSTELHIPARISMEQTAIIKEMAVRAYKALDCRGLARVDFFALPNGDIILNEINTLPGFTSISMYPKLFMASNMSYQEIIGKLIELALEK